MSDEKPAWMAFQPPPRPTWDQVLAKSAPVLAESLYKPRSGGNTFKGPRQGDYKKSLNNMGYALVKTLTETLPMAPVGVNILERYIWMTMHMVDRHMITLIQLTQKGSLKSDAPVRVFLWVLTFKSAHRWWLAYIAAYAKNLGVKVLFYKQGATLTSVHVVGREGPAVFFKIMVPWIYDSVVSLSKNPDNGPMFAKRWTEAMIEQHRAWDADEERFCTPRRRYGRKLMEAREEVARKVDWWFVPSKARFGVEWCKFSDEALKILG